MTNKPLTYLACPYSHENRAIRKFRFTAVSRAAGKLMEDGMIVFSPISHSHPIAEVSNLPLTWDYWEKFCMAYMSHCNQMIVIMLEGWKESVGVTAEIEIANKLGIPVTYVTLERILKGV